MGSRRVEARGGAGQQLVVAADRDLLHAELGRERGETQRRRALAARGEAQERRLLGRREARQRLPQPCNALVQRVVAASVSRVGLEVVHVDFAALARDQHLQLGLVEHLEPSRVDEVRQTQAEGCALLPDLCVEVVVGDQVDVASLVPVRDGHVASSWDDLDLLLLAEHVLDDRVGQAEILHATFVRLQEHQILHSQEATLA